MPLRSELHCEVPYQNYKSSAPKGRNKSCTCRLSSTKCTIIETWHLFYETRFCMTKLPTAALKRRSFGLTSTKETSTKLVGDLHRIYMHNHTGAKRLILVCKSTLHGSGFQRYCSPQLNTNKTLALSQNELCGACFISPLIQCPANTDEAAA